MRSYTCVRTVIAAAIIGFNNAFVLTAEGRVHVGDDWLTANTPRVGDLMVSLGGGGYDLIRAADAADWEEGEIVSSGSGVPVFVITDGDVWMNPKGGKTKKVKNARVFTSEAAAREIFMDGELPDGFSIVKLDTLA